jgi:hypothetical protein
VDRAASGKTVETGRRVEITLAGKAGSLLGLLVLLSVGPRLRQATTSSRVVTAGRTPFEVGLQDITSVEGVLADTAHVWTLTSIYRELVSNHYRDQWLFLLTTHQVALEMLEVAVCV